MLTAMPADVATCSRKKKKTDLRADWPTGADQHGEIPPTGSIWVNFTVGLRGQRGSLNPANGILNSWPNPHDPDDTERDLYSGVQDR